MVSQLLQLPGLVEKTLQLDGAIQELAGVFVEKHHALFLGRGPLQALALEGALKLKEISYIHAEGYAAAELKHGPLALVDEDMPVVAVAPNNELLSKLKSNLHEVRARGGKLYVFADPKAGMESEDGITVITMPVHCTEFQAPVVFAIPMQCWPITLRCSRAPMSISRGIGKKFDGGIKIRAGLIRDQTRTGRWAPRGDTKQVC